MRRSTQRCRGQVVWCVWYLRFVSLNVYSHYSLSNRIIDVSRTCHDDMNNIGWRFHESIKITFSVSWGRQSRDADSEITVSKRIEFVVCVNLSFVFESQNRLIYTWFRRRVEKKIASRCSWHRTIFFQLSCYEPNGADFVKSGRRGKTVRKKKIKKLKITIITNISRERVHAGRQPRRRR